MYFRQATCFHTYPFYNLTLPNQHFGRCPRQIIALTSLFTKNLPNSLNHKTFTPIIILYIDFCENSQYVFEISTTVCGKRYALICNNVLSSCHTLRFDRLYSKLLIFNCKSSSGAQVFTYNTSRRPFLWIIQPKSSGYCAAS